LGPGLCALVDPVILRWRVKLHTNLAIRELFIEANMPGT
jgi:hypothetical protein